MIDPVAARRIQLVAFDVDGTLTDNGVIIGVGADNTRMELKRYDVQDGLGIVMLRRAGLAVAFLSARESASTAARAAELGVTLLVQRRGLHKVPALSEICGGRGLSLDQVAFVGDDLADLAVMQRVGLAAAPANAVAEVRAVAHLQLERGGGHGAAREFAEALLRARGEWDALVQAYVEQSVLHEAVPA
jgi:3-deoxy-D-manno-octulosonate 8-phosphate phosphatase (KDO 8-P phosphatase)